MDANAQFKLKDTRLDAKKVLLRQLEANLHLLFTRPASELKKATFLDVLSRVDSQFNVHCAMELQNEIADTVFHGNELVEYDLEVIIQKLGLKVDAGRLCGK